MGPSRSVSPSARVVRRRAMTTMTTVAQAPKAAAPGHRARRLAAWARSRAPGARAADRRPLVPPGSLRALEHSPSAELRVKQPAAFPRRATRARPRAAVPTRLVVAAARLEAGVVERFRAWRARQVPAWG